MGGQRGSSGGHGCRFGWSGRLHAWGIPGQRPELEETGFRGERSDAVRRGAAVGGEQEEVREAEVHRGVRPCSDKALRSGMRLPRPRCHDIIASLSCRCHWAAAREGSPGVRPRRPLGHAHVVDVGHAGHAFAEEAHEVDVHVDESSGVDGARRQGAVRAAAVADGPSPVAR